MQMHSPDDKTLCVASDQNEFQPRLGPPQWGSTMGSEVWDREFLSAFSRHGQPHETGVHGESQRRSHHQVSESSYFWLDPVDHAQEAWVDEPADAVLPGDQWNYVDVEDLVMYGMDDQELSSVSDTVEGQFTDNGYDFSQLQLQEDVSVASTTPLQQNIDYTYGSTMLEQGLEWRFKTPIASAQAGVPIYASFRAAREATLPKDWWCPADDPTLPKTDAERQKYVHQLLVALNNTENTIGVQGVSFKKRWYDPIKGHSNYYTPLVKEALCWLILFQAESLHTRGPGNTFTSFDPRFWNAAKQTRKWSFAERVDRISELLATSKSKCDALLGGGSLQPVVANPGQRLRATRADVKQNEKRKELLGGAKGKAKENKMAKVGE